MKIKKNRYLRTGALIAVGVFLGRGAHADTTITFDCTAVANHAVLTDCIPPQINNPNAPPGITNYGNYAAASSPGIAVSGFGTPNIGLTWGSDNWPTTRWEYYNTSGGLWGDGAGGSGVVQLQDSAPGTTEELTFTPNNPSASVTIESFKFFPYYNDNERFTYNVSVVSGTHVLSGPTRITYLSDGTKNHLVTLNYTGAPGQTLKLKLARVASNLATGEIEGNAYNNAVDDIAFAQTPATTFPAGPQVISVTPADDTTGLPANSSPAYTAIITNGPTLTFATPVQLKLDGAPVSPPPTVTPLGGGLTQVSYPGAAGLLASGDHLYTLVYADSGGGHYTNEVVFNTTYATLPAAFALPPGSGVVTGFNFRLVSASLQATNNLDNTIARAIAQLNGTLTNPVTMLPFTNDAAPGTNADGSYSYDTVINFDGDGFDEGDFPGDQPFPGLFTPPNFWFSTEALLFLDLPAGYYRFGVNSDDGFEVNALPRAGLSGAPMVLGVFDGPRGAGDTLFDVLVTTPGIYPFQVIYFQGTGYSTEEFFSVTNLATGGKVLVNDVTNPSAIRSYREVRPVITSAKSGSNLVLNWTYGAPPYQLQFKNKLTDATWSNIGSPTTSQTATVPITPGTGFFRVYSQ